MQIYRTRIKNLQKQLTALNKPYGFLLGTAPVPSLGVDPRFRQDSNYFYLTGSNDYEAFLWLDNENSKPILYSVKQSPLEIVWEGQKINVKELSQNLGLESRELSRKEIEETILKNLLKKQIYYYHPDNELSLKICQRVISLPSNKRANLPAIFKHVDTILQKFRLIKDSHELASIKKAIKLSQEVFFAIVPKIKNGLSESKIFAEINYHYHSNQAEPAFSSIVASGKSAATLHYSKHNRSLKSGELILLDYGSKVEGYCSDISRVLPVSGRFTSVQSDIYALLLDAQKTVISKIKPGVKISDLEMLVGKIITPGLKELKVLKGTLKSLITRKQYKQYFCHSLGHSLGIDVHDYRPVGDERMDVLEEGMVITVEPGLYFPKRVGLVSPSGYRIEDDILVTRNSHVNLSAEIPKEIKDIEALMR